MMIKGQSKAEYYRQYQDTNREKLNNYSKTYYAANKQHIMQQTKEYQRKYYLDHCERMIATSNHNIKVCKQTDLEFLINPYCFFRGGLKGKSEFLRLFGGACFFFASKIASVIVSTLNRACPRIWCVLP
jgi:hypothetical protein